MVDKYFFFQREEGNSVEDPQEPHVESQAAREPRGQSHPWKWSVERSKSVQVGQLHRGREHPSQPKAVIRVWACFSSAGKGGSRGVIRSRSQSKAILAFIASSKSARPRRVPTPCGSRLTCQENLELIC